MTDKVLCPWCGGEMVPGPFGFDSTGGAWFECEKCGAQSPLSYDNDGTEKSAIEGARIDALRRYEPPVRPLTLEELEADLYCYPCWIEDVMYLDPFPEVLDKDSAGYFGQVDAAKNTDIHYFLPDDYGKTWRCWPRKTTNAERKAYGWEDAK